MALSDFLKTMKADNAVVNRLDQFLLMQSYNKDADRRWDVNSPSMTGGCPRALFLSRTQVKRDLDNTARGVRILDNGTHVHERLETYLLDANIALVNEIPIVNDPLEIQGHADLIISLEENQELVVMVDESQRKIKKVVTESLSEVAVGEIKSINSRGFSQLKDAKEEHKAQAMCYLYSMEERRKFIKKKCKNIEALLEYQESDEYALYMDRKYGYLTDGSKFSAEEKFNHKVTHYKTVDVLLFLLEESITKMVFLYECKDTQDMKEFTVEIDSEMTQDMIDFMTVVNKAVLSYFKAYRKYLWKNGGEIPTDIEKDKLRVKFAPDKAGTSKSCATCRWCRFKGFCWVM